MAISPRNSIDGTSAPPPFSLPDSAASPAARIAVPVSLDAPPPPHALPDGSPAARLLAQIEALSAVGTDGGVDFGALQTWMQTAETVALAREWLVDAVGISSTARRRRRAPSSRSSTSTSTASRALRVGRGQDHEARGQAVLRATAPRASAPPPPPTATAATAPASGAPSSARRCAARAASSRRGARRTSLNFLHALFEEVVAARGRAVSRRPRRRRNTPPEATFAQIARLGGAEAEAAARQLYGRNFEAVDGGAELRRRVAAAAQRAMLDVVKEQLAGGDTSGLLLLGELQKAMLATVAHRCVSATRSTTASTPSGSSSRRRRAEEVDVEVHNLMLYVARTIEGWQAFARQRRRTAAAWVAGDGPGRGDGGRRPRPVHRLAPPRLCRPRRRQRRRRLQADRRAAGGARAPARRRGRGGASSSSAAASE